MLHSIPRRQYGPGNMLWSLVFPLQHYFSSWNDAYCKRYQRKFYTGRRVVHAGHGGPTRSYVLRRRCSGNNGDIVLRCYISSVLRQAYACLSPGTHEFYVLGICVFQFVLTSRILQIGRALRLAFIEGIHTDMRDRACPHSEIERCRGIWWTVYSMDCHASALMGCPLSVGKPEVETMLPQLHGSPQRRAALGTHVALMEVLWYILQSTMPFPHVAAVTDLPKLYMESTSDHPQISYRLLRLYYGS